METNVLIIKKESIERFFLENSNVDARMIRDHHAYQLMKKEIVIKKSDVLRLSDYIEFHIEYTSLCDNNFPIEYIYSYLVKEYDDISFKLVLSDFNVKPIKQEVTRKDSWQQLSQIL